jgi:hypothetical protein
MPKLRAGIISARTTKQKTRLRSQLVSCQIRFYWCLARNFICNFFLSISERPAFIRSGMDVSDALLWFGGGISTAILFWLPSFLYMMGKRVLDVSVHE